MNPGWAWRQISPSGPNFWTRVTEDETRQLQRLASGRRILEVGSGYGWTASNMAVAGARSVLAVDPHRQHRDNDNFRHGDSGDVMEANVTFYGLGQIVKIDRREPEAALPKLADADARFGLVLVGVTGYSRVIYAIEHTVPLLDDGGILAVLGYGEDDGTTSAVGSLFGADAAAQLTGSLWQLAMATPRAEDSWLRL